MSNIGKSGIPEFYSGSIKAKACLIILLLLSVNTFAQMKAKVKAATTTTGPSVALSCTPSTAGSTATGFNFYRGTVSTGPFTLLGTAPMSTTCAWTDTTVAFATTYYYAATALNAAGESGYSNVATAVVPANPIPNPPTGLTVGTITAAVPLTWQAPSTPVYAYRVFRAIANGNFVEVASGVKTTTWTDHVAPGTYEYEIVAVYDNGKVVSAPSNVQEITVN